MGAEASTFSTAPEFLAVVAAVSAAHPWTTDPRDRGRRTVSFRSNIDRLGSLSARTAQMAIFFFNLVTFVTPLIFVLPCHSIISDFRLRSCAGRRRWASLSQRLFSSARFRLFSPEKI